MMPRIEAAETLAAVNRAALSNNVGFRSELDRERVIEATERRAAGAPPPAAVTADAEDLAAMGIAVKESAGEAATIPDLDAWLGKSGGIDG